MTIILKIIKLIITTKINNLTDTMKYILASISIMKLNIIIYYEKCYFSKIIRSRYVCCFFHRSFGENCSVHDLFFAKADLILAKMF